MSYSTLMIHVGRDPAADDRIRLASGLSERFQASLIGVTGWGPRPAVAAEAGLVVDLGETETEKSDMLAELDRLGERFRRIVGTVNRPVDWRAELDHPVDTVTRAARAADLIVLGRRSDHEDPLCALDPSAVILRAGRPVLLVPPGLARLDPTRVLVAWKDTREARRALVDALPFLHEAERVVLVEVCGIYEEDDAQASLDDVRRWLGRHRISVGAAVTVRPNTSAAAELIRVAEEEKIDLVVAGAYGHSRLGEWIFGGVTRDLINESPVCCLMSH